MAINKFERDLGSFGEHFVKTLQSERERKQKELQFQQEMSYRTRQMNLMNQVYQDRQTLDEQQAFTDVKQGDAYNTLGVPEGNYNTNLMDNLLSGFNKKEVQPKVTDTYENFSEKGYWDTQGEGGKPQYIPNPAYKEKVSGSGSGSNKPSKPVKLGNKYEIEAFNRLKNPGLVEKDMFGNEIYANTPEQKDADFNTMANALLTPSALEQIYKLRKKGGYPSVDELVKSLDNPNLSDEDEQSIEDFIKYYRRY